MNYRLLIISPKSDYCHNCSNFKFFPPITPGIITALTPPNWAVYTIDENIEEISEMNFDLVAITATHYINRVYKLAKLFRAKSVPVILGGLHVTAVPEEAEKYADSIVIGDSESVWKNLINDFQEGKLKKKYISNNYPFSFIQPTFNQFNNKYFAYTLETSRGCFNNCSFCGIHIPYHRDYKRKPKEMIISELKKTVTPFVFIIDNNFYSNDENEMLLLLDEIIKQKINKVFFAAVSTSFFKNELLVEKAAKAGIRMVYVGFESETIESLKELNKKNHTAGITIFKEYKRIIDISHKYGILVTGKAIIGLENDTEVTIKNRIEFFSKLRADEFSYAILTPLPNSILFEKLKKENRLLYTNFPEAWIKYDQCISSYKHKYLSKEKLEEYIDSYKKPELREMMRAFFITKSLKAFLLYYAYNYYFINYKNSFLFLILKVFTKLKGYSFPTKLDI